MAAAPADLRALLGRIVFMSDGAGGSQATPAQLRPPLVSVTRPGGDNVDEMTLKTSVVVPFKDTPFVEVSVTQAWSQAKTNTKPDTWWGLEFYGMHWDEAINHVNPGDRGKDWGAGLGNMAGGGRGLEAEVHGLSGACHRDSGCAGVSRRLERGDAAAVEDRAHAMMRILYSLPSRLGGNRCRWQD